MEDKKKVKSIESSDNSDFEKENKEKKSNKANLVKDAYFKDLADFDARAASKSKLKYIVAFMLGIVATIALFSFLTRGNGNVVNTARINDKGVNGAVANIYDATVYIQNYSGGNISTTGTGFVYKKDRTKGYVLTNYHVAAGSSSLKITLSDDTKVDAKFVGGDKYTDIAVLSIPSKNVKAVANIGSSSSVDVGSTVFTVGSPINNDYRGTVTRGILSGKNRIVTIKSNENTDYAVLKLLQTDASVNPGNSGGPLCSSNGSVIGMISRSIVKDNLDGVFFAISMEDIKARLNTYEKGTSSSKPYIGISMVNLSDSSSMAYYGLSSRVSTSRTNGVVVESVKNNSAGSGILRVGDIIVQLGGVDTPNMAYLRYELYKYNAGDTLKLRIERDGKMRNVSIVLKERKGN